MLDRTRSRPSCATHADAGVLGTYPYDAALPEYREKIGRFHRRRAEPRSRSCRTRARPRTSSRSALDWQPGDEVLLCDNEFPANAVPWIALRAAASTVRMLATERGAPDPGNAAARALAAHAPRRGFVGFVRRRLSARSRRACGGRARSRCVLVRRRDARARRLSARRARGGRRRALRRRREMDARACTASDCSTCAGGSGNDCA